MREKKSKLGEILVEQGIISPEDLAKALGAQKGIACIKPGMLKIDPAALRLVSEAIARHHNIIPISVNGDVMQLAVTDADDMLVLDALTSLTQKKIVPLIAPADEIEKAITDNYSLEVADDEIVVPDRPDTENSPASPYDGRTAGKSADRDIKSHAIEQAFSGLDFNLPSNLKTAANEVSNKRAELESLFSHIETFNETASDLLPETGTASEPPPENADAPPAIGLTGTEISNGAIEPEAIKLIPETVARKFDVIPIRIRGNVLQVAATNADDITTIEALSAWARMRIELVVSGRDGIRKAIERNYTASAVVDKPSKTEDSRATKPAKKDAPAETVSAPRPEKEPEAAILPGATVDINTCPIQPEALKLIPEGIARKFDVIPIRISGNVLQVAATNTDDITTIEALTAWARMRIELVVSTRDDIRRAIDRNYKAYGEIEKQFKAEDSAVVKPAKYEEPSSSDAAPDAPVVRALDLLMKEAIKNHSSDIHIEPNERGIAVRYRIDGVLHEAMTLPSSAHSPLISRLKIMANMNIADQRRPQDGQFSVMVSGRSVDVRVATIFTAHGEMAVLRILDNTFAGLTLDHLGFSKENLSVYEKMVKAPFGMILISGPTGSGKTTTLYASLKNLDCKGRKVITIEDPVEYRYQNISQIQINPRAGLTFATGLRSIMRLDPDVILVGEIRDPETAEIAVQAALTGHLVMASIHANDAVGAIYRILELGVPPYLVSSSLTGSVAQRMVRRICPKCRDFKQAPIEARTAYNLEMGEERTEFYYGRGCNSCANTGYQGRIAVFEMMTMSDEVRSKILTGAGSDEIRAQALKEGMTSMWHDGMLKVKAGITTPCEILRNVSYSK